MNERGPRRPSSYRKILLEEISFLETFKSHKTHGLLYNHPHLTLHCIFIWDLSLHSLPFHPQSRKSFAMYSIKDVEEKNDIN